MNNILIIGFVEEDMNKIAKEVADSCDLYFLDAQQYIDYTLFDKDQMNDVLGIEFLQNKEQKIAKGCANFENTVVSMPLHLFMNNEVCTAYKNSTIVYIYYDFYDLKKTVEKLEIESQSFLAVNLLDFENRDKTLKAAADIVVENTSCDCKHMAQIIVKELRGKNEKL